MSKKIWCIIICSLFVIIVLPIAIDWLIIGNDFPSNITNSDWVGFLGGYVGSILGCIISLVGILWTIKFTREQNRADRELQIRPYLDIRYVQLFEKLKKEVLWLGYVMINEFDENDADFNDAHRGLLYLKNVGNGPATNINVTVSVENIKVKYNAKFTNQNMKVTSNSIQPSEESTISFIITNNRIAPSKDELTWNEHGFAYCDHIKYPIPDGYNITIQLSYNDLLGNAFNQELKFTVHYHMSCDKEKGGSYGCDLHLEEIGAPQKK